MNAFHNLATSVRKRVFRRSVRQQTQKLDPVVRRALEEEIAPEETTLATELEQVEAELAQAQEALASAESKEVFLGQRSRQYRLAQDEKARRLKEETKALQQLEEEAVADMANDDEEHGGIAERRARLEEQMEKWERDEDALQTVIETHRHILADCESMRRTIKELEKKQKDCRGMMGETHDFLEEAQQTNSILNEDDSPGIETEMQRLSLANNEEEEAPEVATAGAGGEEESSKRDEANEDEKESILNAA